MSTGQVERLAGLVWRVPRGRDGCLANSFVSGGDAICMNFSG